MGCALSEGRAQGIYSGGDEAVPWGFQDGSMGKASACNVGDAGLVPGLGRPPGEGNDYLLQYSLQENPMDRRVWETTVHGVPKSWT